MYANNQTPNCKSQYAAAITRAHTYSRINNRISLGNFPCILSASPSTSKDSDPFFFKHDRGAEIMQCPGKPRLRILQLLKLVRDDVLDRFAVSLSDYVEGLHVNCKSMEAM